MLAAPAFAQVPKGLGPLSAGQNDVLQNGSATSAKRYDDGVAALQAKNFVVAESIFTDYLRANPQHPQANFLMGVVEMSLDKWPEAKKYLEIAVRKNPKAPDPKSRLGVTLAKLGDFPGAMEQRAELEKLDKDCKGQCRDAQYITSGLAMIDQAIAPKQ